MPPRKKAAAPLRAVGDDEKLEPEKVAAKSVTEAAESGTPRELLVALRTRIARQVQDPKCPARDLASLSRRLLEIAREIEQIDAEEGGDDVGNAAETPDADFDAGAL
jgi:hypothetical protein